MNLLNFNGLIAEVSQTKDECLDALDKIKKIEVELNQTPSGKTLVSNYRTISIPMIYASWESHFTSSIAICFRALKDIDKLACDHSPHIRAIWLQQETFFTKYIDMIKNIYDVDSHKSLSEKMATMKKKIKKGHYKLTTEVLESIDKFNKSVLNQNVNVEELVMTFSNVNKVVTEMNMEVVGLNSAVLDLTKLDELVGLRNALGHGQFSTIIGDRQFSYLIEYTENLINALYTEIESWIINLSNQLNTPPQIKSYELNGCQLFSVTYNLN